MLIKLKNEWIESSQVYAVLQHTNLRDEVVPSFYRVMLVDHDPVIVRDCSAEEVSFFVSRVNNHSSSV